MRVEDLFEILKTILVSLDMVFDHERDRIQTILWVQLIAYTGNRPAAISALCYKNFKVALIRDPDREYKETLVIDVTAADTKGYLGEKDACVSFSYPQAKTILGHAHQLMLYSGIRSLFLQYVASAAFCSVSRHPSLAWHLPTKHLPTISQPKSFTL